MLPYQTTIQVKVKCTKIIEYSIQFLLNPLQSVTTVFHDFIVSESVTLNEAIQYYLLTLYDHDCLYNSLYKQKIINLPNRMPFFVLGENQKCDYENLTHLQQFDDAVMNNTPVRFWQPGENETNSIYPFLHFSRRDVTVTEKCTCKAVSSCYSGELVSLISYTMFERQHYLPNSTEKYRERFMDIRIAIVSVHELTNHYL